MYGCIIILVRAACAQVKGRDERLAKAETLLRATLAAKDQEVEAAQVRRAGRREAFAACFSRVKNVDTVTGETYLRVLLS